MPVREVVRPHRLPGDPGRAGQDAGAADPWRHPRPARPARAPRADAGARHRADRPGLRQPLPVRGDGRRGAPAEDCVENIDIGGPALIRAAAKNHAHVAVLTDPAQYAALARGARRHGGTTLALRRRLAGEAYARTAAYDAAIAAWFAREDDAFPQRLDARRHAAADAALRREPAPAGGLLRDRRARPASPRRGRCRARSCPTTT